MKKKKIKTKMKDNSLDIQFSKSPEIISFNWAVGPQIVMGFHENAHGNGGYQLNLVTGVLIENKETLKLIHGGCMFCAWALFATFGICASRNREFKPFAQNKNKGYWFLCHRVFMLCTVLCVCVCVSVCMCVCMCDLLCFMCVCMCLFMYAIKGTSNNGMFCVCVCVCVFLIFFCWFFFFVC